MIKKFKYPITRFTDLLGKLGLYDLLVESTAGEKGKEFLEAEFTDIRQKKSNWIYQLIGERILLTVGTKMEVEKIV